MPKLIWRKPNAKNEIFLTFDDGPIPEVTPWVLDLLEKENVKATFFCIGANVKTNPDIYANIISRGHAVGNHSYNHLSGWDTQHEEYIRDVEKATTIISSKLFRPPYGRLGLSQYKTLKDRYDIIMWDVLSRDYDETVSPEKCVQNVLTYTLSGSIIVMHDSIKADKNLRDSLPIIIRELKAKGFVFQKISAN